MYNIIFSKEYFNVNNCVECNVNNVDNNAILENNANFLISSKHTVDKVSKNTVNINSSNGGVSAFIYQTNMPLSGLAPPRGDCPSFVFHAGALTVAGEVVE